MNEKHFLGITVKVMTRKENGEADELAKAVVAGQPLENSFFDVITQPSYERKGVMCIENKDDWREPILKYVVSAQLHEKEEEARRIQLMSKKVQSGGKSNGKIMKAIKKRLEGSAKGKWSEDLLSVLWAPRTTIVRSTGMTHFRLVYRDEARTML